MPSADPLSGARPPSLLPSSTSASKPFSMPLGASKAKSSTSVDTLLNSARPQNPRKRPHSSLNDDSDSDADDRAQRTPQLVSAFDHSAGGAIAINGREKANEPLVIQALKNRNWREESRRKRGKNLLPAEVQAQRAAQSNRVNGQGDVERDEVGKATGLSFVQKEEDVDVPMRNGAIDDQAKAADPKTVDEEALEALMGTQARISTLVVPAIKVENEEYTSNGRPAMNEDDYFRSDVSSRPDSASLDDYARVPVEDFGLGMLRGMGWKEGEVVGKRKSQVSKARVVERRPALLGIGAKEVPGGVGDELGAWGKEARGKRKLNKMYNPVLLKNSKTGEMLTEEELQAKKEKQKEAEKEWSDRRDRNLAIDEEKKSKRKRKDRGMECEDEASGSRRRERSRSPGSRHSSLRQERSRSSSRRYGSSRRERSKSRERHHHSRRRDYDDNESRHRDRRRHEGDDSRSSKHSHRSRDNDTRRRA
ncbi:MAG: hypothetical protein Q9209_007842 [Squamulea sp. 1 TL-2023]